MLETALKTLVGALVGYLISIINKQGKKLKQFKDRDELQNKALMIMLQTNLTNTYFVYSRKREIEDYVLKNWLNELKIYEALGGDDFIHILADDIRTFKIIQTKFLDK